MSMFIGITQHDERLTKRGHSQAMRRTNWFVGRYHRRHNLPKHFSGAPETKSAGGYHYRQRRRVTNRRKQRLRGHTIPLRDTGRLAQTVMSSSIIRRTQHKWTLTARGYFSMPETMRNEIEAISNREVRQLTKLSQRRYASLANRSRYQSRRVRKIS